MNSPHPYTVESLIVRRAVLSWLMSFADKGADNFGGTPFTDATARVLEEAGLIEVWRYKPESLAINRRGYRKVARRYRKVSVTPAGKRFAAWLRNELRWRNLAAVWGLDDGVGRVGFAADYRARREVVVAAALSALAEWRKLEPVFTRQAASTTG